MIRVISKQLILALTVVSFSLSSFTVYAEDGGDASKESGGSSPGGSVITPKPESADNDKKGEQLDDAKLNKKFVADPTLIQPSLPEINTALEKYLKDEKPTCVSRHDAAAGACLEHLSGNMIDTVTTLNTLMSTLGMVAVKDNCDNFSKAMDIAKKGMTAYTAACGTMKAGCGMSCVGARKSLERLKAIVAKEQANAKCNPASATACNQAALSSYKTSLTDISNGIQEELNQAEKKSMAGKAQLCTQKYAQLLTSALAGIASLLNSINQGNKCEEQSQGNDPTTTADVCADPAKAKTEECVCKNPNAQECICLRNPRTPGCSNELQKPGETSTGTQITTGATDKTNVTANSGDVGNLGGNPGMTTPDIPKNESSASLPGAPTGGSAGLGGGSSGSGGGDSGKGDASRKGLDANILAGTGGGGGGGGWGAYGGSGGSDKYRAYLPGGAKDPSRGVAGQQQAWTKEVTGQGGKSNWEKVKERYRDNRNTLLNN